ncbi:hydroxysteroid 11-beta-dehydrogenase 1-like protein isoform X1 [Mytilus edulis]|uniref:hydroxysteroid 11-beta-dehydrogenase 1-like protein isoform X1 n=1 Tax=Mytilus edulis TaxID=6550 RepID=UPI0039F02F73
MMFKSMFNSFTMWKKILAAVLGILVGYWLIDDFDPDLLKGKRVLITGASAGIGEQMAYHYAKMGANVIVTARREQKLQEVVAKCKELGRPDGIYHYISADMSNLTSTELVIREAHVKLGGIDYLVLNHIIVIPLGMWRGTVDNLTRMDKIVDVNYKSYVHLTSHALPLLEESRGSIVVVSSLAGKVAQPFSGVYSSTKFALDGFFGSIRQEFALRNCDVSITLCVIGLVGTESAISELRNFGQHFLLKYIKAAEPPDAAYAIIRGGALRAREIYFPYMETRVLTLLRDLLPRTVDYINRWVYTTS